MRPICTSGIYCSLYTMTGKSINAVAIYFSASDSDFFFTRIRIRKEYFVNSDQGSRYPGTIICFLPEFYHLKYITNPNIIWDKVGSRSQFLSRIWQNNLDLDDSRSATLKLFKAFLVPFIYYIFWVHASNGFCVDVLQTGR